MMAPTHRRAIIALGVAVLAVSIVGIWRSLPPNESMAAPESAAAPTIGRGPVLVPHRSPQALTDVRFEDRDGRQRSLSDFHGKLVLLNVWATWCAPCRAEMPTLDRLQSALGGKDFEVVALSIDRGGQSVVDRFFKETKLRSLAIYVDKTMDAQARLNIVGVPTTLLIGPDGRELARHAGPAVWDSPEVIATIKRYLPAHPS